MDAVFVRTVTVDWEQIAEVLLLRQYNTRIVVIGVMVLGIAGGMIGSFLLLRKRALFGDAISHATLPGIATAYIVMVSLFGTGKSLPVLLLGALVFGLIGMGGMLLIRNLTPLKDDTAIGVVLSVFFGAGIALFGVIQKMRTGHAAGLEGYIYGKTASMIAQDALIIAAAAAMILAVTLIFIKELNLSTFDPAFAASEGYPVLLLDILVIGLSVGLTVIGLQAVGLILILALLIIPAAAARFWTDRLSVMLALSAAFGALSGYIGAALSASIPNLPAGAVIVLTAGAIFPISTVFGSRNGLISYGVLARRFRHSLARRRILMTFFQYRDESITLADLKEERTIGRLLILVVLREVVRSGLILPHKTGFQLTGKGLSEARKAWRNHELQHMYLRAFPEQAQSLHQRDEEHIEDFVSSDVLAILHAELKAARPELYEGGAS
jgi:manganese/zinc/iron transport system permease protein